jgi:hypothetical protein
MGRFIFHPREAAQVGAGAKEGFDLVAAGGQFMDHVGADKTGGAGDETFHGLREQAARRSSKHKITLFSGRLFRKKEFDIRKIPFK